MDKYYITIVRFSIKRINLSVYLVSDSIMFILLPFNSHLIPLNISPDTLSLFLLLLLRIPFFNLFFNTSPIIFQPNNQSIQLRDGLLAHPLSLAHVHLRLKHVIHERVAACGTLVKVLRLLESRHYELVNQGERPLDLHTVVVLDVDLQILGTDSARVLEVVRQLVCHIHDVGHSQMLQDGLVLGVELVS